MLYFVVYEDWGGLISCSFGDLFFLNGILSVLRIYTTSMCYTSGILILDSDSLIGVFMLLPSRLYFF